MNDTGICYGCNQKINSNDIETHYATCRKDNFEMCRTLNTTSYILRIETTTDKEPDDDWTIDNTFHYWHHVCVPTTITLHQLDTVIRYTWFNCCNTTHVSLYVTNNNIKFANNCETKYDPQHPNKSQDCQNTVEIHHLLKNKNDYIDNHFDAVLTTRVRITLVDIIQNDKYDGSNTTTGTAYVLGQNSEPQHECGMCKQHTAKFYCFTCKNKICETCMKTHGCKKLKEAPHLQITNDPRTGIHCQHMELYATGKKAIALYALFEQNMQNFGGFRLPKGNKKNKRNKK